MMSLAAECLEQPTDVAPFVSSTQADQISSTTISPPENMKDAKQSSTKAARLSAYPRKRPSPYGVSKSHQRAPSASAGIRKTPRATRGAPSQRRLSRAVIVALRRDGIFLEEEYQDEIRFYMHEMEVSPIRVLDDLRC